MRVLGVDGGQSGIRLRASDADRTVEVAGVSRAAGDTVAAVAAAVSRGWHDGGFGAVERVVLGLSTVPSTSEAADRLAAMVADATGAPEVWVTDDAVTAHAGALSLGWGVSVVAGTGVATLSLPERGEPRILGGHGFLLGDEGGAFWIGRRGIAAVLRAAEGTGEPTRLTEAAVARFGPVAGLHVRLHDAERPVDTIARFAPDVITAAEAGDAAAIVIAEDAVRELVVLVRRGVALTRPDHGPGRCAPVALGGRLLAADGPLRARLDAGLAHAGLDADVRTADGSALDGTLLLGTARGHRYGSLVHHWRGGTA